MIKPILDQLASISGTNAKMDYLKLHKENELLQLVLQMALASKYKFYLKRIPPIQNEGLKGTMDLEAALQSLNHIAMRFYTGGEAFEYLRSILEAVSDDDAVVIERIIGKDLKIGMQAANINKVMGKNFIPETPYMGAVSYSEAKVEALLAENKENQNEFPVTVLQTKMDGRYCNILLTEEGIYMESRSGEETHLYDAKFVGQLNFVRTAVPAIGVLTGELTIPGIPRYKSNGIINALSTMSRKHKEGEDVSKSIKKFEKENNCTPKEMLDRIHFTAWDCIPLDAYYLGRDDAQYASRLAGLTFIFEFHQNAINSVNETQEVALENTLSVVPSVPVWNLTEAKQEFQKLLTAGEEGGILKSLLAPWKDGKPNFQVKMKLEMSVDLKIVGFQEGTKGTKNEGKLSVVLLESSCGKLKSKAGGLKESEVDFITANQDALLGTIAEIRCCGITKVEGAEYNALLHPSLVAFRDDKLEADSLEECLQNEAMCLSL